MEERGGSFYSTYAWHPRSVAAAIATLRDLKAHRTRMLAGVAEMSEYFRVHLLQLKFDRPAAFASRTWRRVEGPAPSLATHKRTAATGLYILARSI
jgi:hypothetical protein